MKCRFYPHRHNYIDARLALCLPVHLSQILRVATLSTKLLFLCSPGNPTGKSVPASVIREILEGGFDGMVVVDEAYVDFSGHESACSLIDELDRVIVLQTLSKAFGMAAIRYERSVFASPFVCT